MTTPELFALIRTRIETLQSVSSKGCPQREALAALGELEKIVNEKEPQRIREIACQCAAQAICCRQDGEAPVPMLWSMAVFFETYILEGSAGTSEEFGPSDPVELKTVP